MADAVAPQPLPDPYRFLFPIGMANSVAGALLWMLSAIGLIAWPGPLHRIFMIEGFEHAFIMGFLLTAMPAFTHGERCRPLELMLAVASVVLVDACALAGLFAAAHAAYLAGLVTIAVAGLRRVLPGKQKPPEEFLFAALGLALGIAGAVMLMGDAAGWWSEPQPRFAARLVSLGFVLSVVLGVGSLLVPTFTGMRAPLEIPGVAHAHQRGPRRALYLPLIALLISAFVFEAAGHARAGAMVRAAVGVVMGLLVWKSWRPPAQWGIPAYTLWLSGWLMMIGLVTVAIWPLRALAGEHIVFIGGFGLVTLGVATRVVTSHGGHPLAIEPRVLDWPVVLGVAVALGLRVIAEFAGPEMGWLLGASGAAWALAWITWAVRAGALISAPDRQIVALFTRPR